MSRVKLLAKHLRRAAEVRAGSLGFGPEGFEEHEAAAIIERMYNMLSDLELMMEDCWGLMSDVDRAKIDERPVKAVEMFFWADAGKDRSKAKEDKQNG